MYNDYKICEGADLEKLSQEYNNQSKVSLLRTDRDDSPIDTTPNNQPSQSKTPATTLSPYNFSSIGTALQQTIDSTLNPQTKTKLQSILSRFASDFPYNYDPTQRRVRGSINRRLFNITRLLLQASEHYINSDPYKSSKLLSYANDISGLYNMRII